MDLAAIEWITDRALAALGSGEMLDAPALTFLLRRYGATGRADLLDALEPALARAIARQGRGRATNERAAWLALFSEASALSDDERLPAAAAELVAALRHDWGRATAVEAAMVSVDACLATVYRAERAEPHADVPLTSEQISLVREAIDELERVLAAAYRPGEGLVRSLDDPSGERGCLREFLSAASALLTAYAVTRRLPYAMLAEELIQSARRTLWDHWAGAFVDGRLDERSSFVLNCEAARVLCRLARLHATREYRDAAVIAADADYGTDAMRILDTLSEGYGEHGWLSTQYGLAVLDWQALRGELGSGSGC